MSVTPATNVKPAARIRGERMAPDATSDRNWERVREVAYYREYLERGIQSASPTTPLIVRLFHGRRCHDHLPRPHYLGVLRLTWPMNSNATQWASKSRSDACNPTKRQRTTCAPDAIGTSLREPAISLPCPSMLPTFVATGIVAVGPIAIAVDLVAANPENSTWN